MSGLAMIGEWGLAMVVAGWLAYRIPKLSAAWVAALRQRRGLQDDYRRDAVALRRQLTDIDRMSTEVRDWRGRVAARERTCRNSDAAPLAVVSRKD